MKRKINGSRLFLLCSLTLFCTATFANGGSFVPAPTHTGYFDAIVAASLSTAHTGNSLLGVTSSEIDTLVQTNDNQWKSWGGQVGVGYVYLFSHAQKYSDHVQWFPMIEPELNFYFGKYQSKGDVYRFGSAAFNELSYDSSIISRRLMFDTALTVTSWHHLSAYVIAGLGDAWNRVGYSDAPNLGAVCAIQNIYLNSKHGSNFAWEAGAGVTVAFNDRVGVSAQYLYTDFNHLRTSGVGSTGIITAPIISSPRFNLHAQAVLLGLHVAIA